MKFVRKTIYKHSQDHVTLMAISSACTWKWFIQFTPNQSHMYQHKFFHSSSHSHSNYLSAVMHCECTSWLCVYWTVHSSPYYYTLSRNRMNFKQPHNRTEKKHILRTIPILCIQFGSGRTTGTIFGKFFQDYWECFDEYQERLIISGIFEKFKNFIVESSCDSRNSFFFLRLFLPTP